MKLSKQDLRNKYDYKIISCHKRQIPFELTFDEYCYMFDINKGFCDYTGLAMSTDHKDPLPVNYVTLERIDEDHKIGYVVGNVILCRLDVNKLKAHTLEDNSVYSSNISPADRKMLDKLCKTLYNPAKIKSLQEKYILPENRVDLADETIVATGLNNYVSEEKKVMTEVVNKDMSKVANKEITLAQGYAEFGSTLEGFGVEFKLTYANYKQLISRKKCTISGKEFTDELKPVLWIKDKKLPVSKDNCVVVTSDIQTALDNLMATAKIDLPTLFNAAKSLVKLSKV